MLDLRKLNKEQKKAVLHKNGPLILVAGPGTGKTAVITSKISFLLKNNVKLEEILALTFTNKAANEIIERVEKNSSNLIYDSWISTFHSFGEKILRNYSLDIGLNPDFKVIEGIKGWVLLKQNLEKLNLNYYEPLNNPNKFISNIISFFNRLKDEDISPIKFNLYAQKNKDKKIKELAHAYNKYQSLLLENNLIDFNDLINYTIKIFKKRPEILNKYKKQFKYFFIDEFQDTNYAQYKLIKFLTSPSSNILISYDSNQSIYYWRGASNINILKFKKDFPKFKEITLIKNYRSFQNILDLSKKISFFIDKNNYHKLISSKKGNGLIEYLYFESSEKEIEGIFSKINEIKNKSKDNFNDFAILTRTNNDANLLARFAENKKIPHDFIGNNDLYQKPIIIDFISYFKLLNNYYENQSAYRVLTFPCWKIPSSEIIEIIQYSNKFFVSIWEAMKRIDSIKLLSKKTIKKIKLVTSLIEKQTKASFREPISEIFVNFLNDSKYLSYLTKFEKIEDLNYLNKFFDKIKKFENLTNEPILKNFIEEIKMELEAEDNANQEIEFNFNKDSIKILTVHSAKGLEFNNVFIFNLTHGKFPLNEKNNLIEVPQEIIKNRKEDYLIQERKLFYVGVTRASNNLFLTSSNNENKNRNKKISKFLIELGYSNNKTKDKLDYEKEEKKRKEKKIKNINKKISYTQLKSFLSCPLQYKYSYIIKIPIQKSPSFIFGKTIHETLYKFNSKYYQKKPEFSKLLSIYKKNWKDEWYNTKNQREKYYKNGIKILKNYYNQETWPLKIYEINKKKLLESSFSFNIKEYTIKGKIDRIDKNKDGAEVIDYKTGNFKKNIEKDEKLQLMIYQIAAVKFFKIKPNKLTFYYLNSNKKISLLADEKKIEKIEKEIIKSIEKIRQGYFQPNPGWNCKYCNYKNICDHKKNN